MVSFGLEWIGFHTNSQTQNPIEGYRRGGRCLEILPGGTKLIKFKALAHYKDFHNDFSKKL